MSTKPYALSLFIFRRDLRLQDNTALIEALRTSERVIPCFIFDERQIKKNDYFSEKSFAFLLTCLDDLTEQLKKHNAQLYFFSGIAEKVVSTLLKKLPIDAVYFNRDYTPFSRARDEAIDAACKAADRTCHRLGDALLHEPEALLKSDGTPYLVYTPFMKQSRRTPVDTPQRFPNASFYTQPITEADNTVFNTLTKKYQRTLIFPGGRTAGLRILRTLDQFSAYDETRDIPARDATTHLSAHNKFGTLSIREVYNAVRDALGAQHTLINELYWRDFFHHIAYHFPEVFKTAFNPRYRQIAWSRSQKNFTRWCKGETGFPIVDAGMRELNETGFMHNRVRMIVASFLTKDCHIHWQWGERYFAQHLIDYDPAVNNGNWQWAASTGVDAQPYFRIFNPWLQQKKFDPDCVYVKRWLPELEHIPAHTLHNRFHPNAPSLPNYPDPMLDHKRASEKAKALFKK